MLDLITFCKKIEPFVIYYKRLIKSYNNTAHNIMKNKIDLIFPQVPRKQKCGIITTLVSQLHRISHLMRAFQTSYTTNEIKHCTKAVKAKENQQILCTIIQHYKLMQLRKFNAYVWCLQFRNIRKLIDTVHQIHNLNHLMKDYLQDNKAH